MSHRESQTEAGRGGALPAGESIGRAFERRVRLHPDRIAFQSVDASVSYGELNRRANGMAWALRGRAPEADQRVGLCMGPGIAQVAAMLGILKAGLTVVVLDALGPSEGARAILEDAAARWLVADPATAEAARGLMPPDCDLWIAGDSDGPTCDRDPDWTVSAEVPACLVFTSGTTGRPKGVIRLHRNFVWGAAVWAGDVGEADEAGDFDLAELIQEHDVAVTVSHEGFVKRLAVDTFRTQGRGGVGVRGSDAKDGDYIERVFIASTHDDLLCFTNTGRVYQIKVWQIPEMSRTAKGRAINSVVELKDGERMVAYLPIKDFERSEDYLFFATSSGRVKRSSLKDFRNVNRSGIISVKLNEGDRLVNVVQTRGNDHILLATAEGMSIRFDENDARVMGRAAAGVAGIDLAENDAVVGLVRCDDQAALFTCTEHGFGKRTSMTEYLVHQEDGQTRAQARGGKGRIDIKTDERNGRVVAVHSTLEDDDLMFISRGGMIVRIRASEVRLVGRNTLGVRVVKLQEDDALVGAACFESGEVAESEAAIVPPTE